MDRGGTFGVRLLHSTWKDGQASLVLIHPLNLSRAGPKPSVGRPKLLFKDQCKASMMEFSINVANWDMVAKDRGGWRAAVLMGAKSYEENRVQRAVQNRQRSKCPTVDDSTVFYYCRHCQNPCRSLIGCSSHERRCVPL